MSKKELIRWVDPGGGGIGDGLSEAVARELDLLRPEVRSDGASVTRVLHEEFCEFGSSGRTWNRREVVAALATEPATDPPEMDGLRAVQLADGVVLLTYRASRPDRVTLRSSLWVRSDDGWQLLFHQGTLSA
jgi:hypothetical protein